MRIAATLLLLLWPALAGAVPLNVGHRGYSAAFPENTLAALRGAFEAGADWVEIDLQKSQDGQVVIFHDDTLERTSDGSGLVGAHTLAELRQLDAGSWFGAGFADEPIPTLEEALLEARARGPLLLDQKSSLLFGSEIAAALATTAFPLEHLWVTAWNDAQVADVRAALPGARILWTATTFGIGPSDFLDHMQAVGVDGISLVFENYTNTFPGLLADAQGRGLLAFAWNLEPFLPETPAKMAQAVQLGLDGYIVNDPALFALLVPEPGTGLLLGLDLALLAGRRRAPV